MTTGKKRKISNVKKEINVYNYQKYFFLSVSKHDPNKCYNYHKYLNKFSKYD